MCPWPHWSTAYSTDFPLVRGSTYTVQQRHIKVWRTFQKAYRDIYYECIKNLGRFGLPGTCQGIDPVCIVLISFFLLISGRPGTGSALGLCKRKWLRLFAYTAGKWDLITRGHSRRMWRRTLTLSCSLVSGSPKRHLNARSEQSLS